MKSIEAVFPPMALRLLMQYDFSRQRTRNWKNIIERAVLLETTELLQPSNLPPTDFVNELFPTYLIPP